VGPEAQAGMDRVEEDGRGVTNLQAARGEKKRPQRMRHARAKGYPERRSPKDSSALLA